MVCLLLLVGLRLALTRFDAGALHRSEIVNAAAYLRDERAADVRVIAFGSSRIRGAFAPEVFAARAGLRPDQVLNLGVGAGRPFDWLHMLREAGGPPPSTELAIVEIGHWTYNRNWHSPATRLPQGIPGRFHYWATLADRLAVDDPRIRAKLVAEWLWPTPLRRPLLDWVEAARAPVQVKPELPEPIPHWIPRRHAYLGSRPKYSAPVVAEWHWTDPAFSTLTLRNLDLVIERLRREGLEVWLVVPPVRDAYIERAREDPAARAVYDEVGRQVRLRAAEGVHVLFHERASDVGLDESIFVDYGHMSRAGAERYTDRLFDAMQQDAHGD